MNCNDASELSPLYLSGELDAARAAELAAHLDACPDCARAVELDSRLRRAVLAERLDTTRADLEIRRRIGRQQRWRRVSIATGIAAMLAVGIVVYPRVYHVVTRDSAVYAAAAQDHRREVVDHERRTWISQTEQVDALAARQGISAPPPASIAGFHLEHGKLCRLNGHLFLHLVYANGHRDFSLFLRQPDSTDVAADRVADVGNECVAGFKTARTAGLVVTTEARDAAEIARTAAAAL
jgi:anti-sigma factor RsiW